MAVALVDGSVRFFRRMFPRRQFYLRSRGAVQFYELSPAIQMFFALLTAAFLGWVAYSSVIVIFNDQIISAKDQRYASMRSYYEGRMSQYQLQYDEVQAMLAMAEERFRSATAELEEKHRRLSGLLLQKTAMENDMRTVKSRVAVMEGFPGRPRMAQVTEIDGANILAMSQSPVENSGRMSRGLEANSESTIATIAAGLGPRKGKISTIAKNPTIRRIAILEDRLMKLKKSQVGLSREIMESTQGEIDKLEAMLGTTGLRVNEIVAQLGMNNRLVGRGGPYIPISASLRRDAVDALWDEFDKEFSKTQLAFNRMDALTTSLARIPLVTPVPNGQYRLTSGYGYRVDPFTGRGAFHSGTDLAGDYGTPILAAAPGRVLIAERKGPYGNFVEIDHGHGIRTRYGHLQSIFVQQGQWVDFRQKIAAMGSTGRSTGPHLHYEIWFKDVVRDPMKFFNAGRYVFQG